MDAEKPDIGSILSALVDLEKIPARVVFGLSIAWIACMTLPDRLLHHFRLDSIPDAAIGWITFAVIALICIQLTNCVHAAIQRRRRKAIANERSAAIEKEIEGRFSRFSREEIEALADLFIDGPHPRSLYDAATSSLLRDGIVERTSTVGEMTRNGPQFGHRIAPKWLARVQQELRARGIEC